MTIKEEIQADLAEIQADRDYEAITFVDFPGEEFQCYASARAKAGRLKEGGIDLEYDLSVTIGRALFAAGDAGLPSIKSSATFDGTRYNVEKVLKFAGGAFVRIFFTR